MECIHHPTNNFLLGPPADGSLPDCKTIAATLLVFEEYQMIVTYWEASAEEIEAIRNGRRVLMYSWTSWLPQMALQVEGVGTDDPQVTQPPTQVEPGILLTEWVMSPEEVQALRKGAKIKMFVWGTAFVPTAIVVEGVAYVDG